MVPAPPRSRWTGPPAGLEGVAGYLVVGAPDGAQSSAGAIECQPTAALGTSCATVVLAEELTNGVHHLVASGVDVNGNPRTLVVEVTVSGGTDVLAMTGFSALPVAGAGALALLAGGGLLVVSGRQAV